MKRVTVRRIGRRVLAAEHRADVAAPGLAGQAAHHTPVRQLAEQAIAGRIPGRDTVTHEGPEFDVPHARRP